MKVRLVLAVALALTAVAPSHAREEPVTVGAALEAYEAQDYARCAETGVRVHFHAASVNWYLGSSFN